MNKRAKPHRQPIRNLLAVLCIPPTAAILIRQLPISELKSPAHCSTVIAHSLSAANVKPGTVFLNCGGYVTNYFYWITGKVI